MDSDRKRPGEVAGLPVSPSKKVRPEPRAEAEAVAPVVVAQVVARANSAPPCVREPLVFRPRIGEGSRRVLEESPCEAGGSHSPHRIYESGPRDNNCGWEDVCRKCGKIVI